MLTAFVKHPIRTARLIVKRIWNIPTQGLPRLPGRGDDRFDRMLGVDTARPVPIVCTDSPNAIHGTKYVPSPEAAIRWSIEHCGLPLASTTFVDLGAGKGRALIVAADYQFRQIIGVEYSPPLAAICRANLRRLGLTGRCAVVLEDAAGFAFPEGNLLVFLYNPFDAAVLTQVLDRLSAAEGPVRVAQLGPGHDVLLASGLARVLCAGDGPTLYDIRRAPVANR